MIGLGVRGKGRDRFKFGKRKEDGIGKLLEKPEKMESRVRVERLSLAIRRAMRLE